MIDGYSVTDTATILGVPEARVWELIARGVLAGRPEVDGGMRVFLKATAPEPAPPTNGGAGHEVELSPFRELLTEFRNLTERYGQALLALGEARGEVASLRSRVDLLEARMDLRLPPGRPLSTVAWEVPDQAVRPAVEPQAHRAPAAERAPLPESVPDDVADADAAAPAPAPTEPDAEAEEETEIVAAPDGTPAIRKRARGLAAAAGFADALARAQDPALPELPGGREAADALAALQGTETPLPEAVEALPEGTAAVTPPADDLAEELPEPAAAAEEEEPVAQGAGPEIEPDGGSDLATAHAEPAEPGEPSPYTTEMVEPDWFADGDFSWLEQAQAAGDVPDADGGPDESAPEPDAAPAPESALPEPIPPTQAVSEEQVFTPAEQAVDLPAVESHDDQEPPADPPSPTSRWPSTPEASAPSPPAESEDEVELMWLGDEFEEAELEQPTAGWPSEEWSTGNSQRAMVRDEASWPGAEMTDDQLSRLASEEGWQADEVDAIRSLLGRGAGQATTGGGAHPGSPLPGDPEWLRGRRGRAATAYRRLRRLFPE